MTPFATPSGKTFDAWYTAAVGGTLITSDTLIKSDIDVWAQWKTT